MLLRGQAGTEEAGAAGWPVGSTVVVMNGAPQQIALSANARDLARHYRIGPSQRSYDDPSYTHLVSAFRGIGLRPYAPVHLRALPGASGELTLSWIRRTRIGGDSWSGLDVPLGEAFEAYLLRIVKAGTVVREVSVAQPQWTYAASMIAADAVAPSFEVHVAQLSDVFGPGPFARMTANV
jgi:hypothetical protein